MWDSLILGPHIATMDAGLNPGNTGRFGIIEDGAVAIYEDRIAWVGHAADLPGEPDDLAASVTRYESGWLTPGLVDCHTHVVFPENRAEEFEARLSGKSYEDIARAGGGIKGTAAKTAAASELELAEAAKSRLGTMMCEGVTTIEVKSGYGLTPDAELLMLRAIDLLAHEVPARITATYLGLHALPAGTADRARYIDSAIALLRKIKSEGLADAADAFLENIAFTADEVDRFFTAASAEGFKLHLHADQLSDGGGGALAAKHRALSADHLEYLNEEGAQAMAAAGTVAVLLPGAYHYLGGKKPPVDMLRRYKIPIAVATDCNPGSSPVLSPLAAMHLATVHFDLTPFEALAGMTCYGAQALGLGDQIGQIKTGYAADLIHWPIKSLAELAYWMGARHKITRYFQGTVQ